MAMKTAMSASAMDFKDQRVFDRNVRSYFGHWIYTPTNHDSDFLGAARAYYYKEYAAHDWAQIHALQHGT